ncbi:MAG: hypothetical protein IT419_03560 [Planctomycetes bacterium]|jgi:predicted XRE-type DNA-binding protein|nr:hypothetical protein [Planctomycetota bacterium]OQZ07332.1 MAG: hypothetical protein B6D36_00435 [Planctomycetes bacterium UTPLA1]
MPEEAADGLNQNASSMSVSFPQAFKGTNPKKSIHQTGDARNQSQLVRHLVLAYQIEQAITKGRASSQAQVAKQLGLTRARLSQIMALRRLAPAIQERLLLDDDAKTKNLKERDMRPILRLAIDRAQISAFNQLVSGL